MLGVKPPLLESLVQNVDNIPDSKLRDMIKFALKCSREPQAITDNDYASLRRHGLNQGEILEIIAMSAFAVYANIIADATAMEADRMFNTL
jgi:alkylhydroperoxidase family enzyme